MMIQKFGLTGSTGFLGRQILEELKRNQVATIGRQHTDDYFFDLANSKSRKNSIRVNCLVHCAGLAHFYPQNKKEKSYFDSINFQGTKRLFESLDLTSLNRIILISTVAVYGKEHGNQLDEDTLTTPTSAYGLSKLKAENFLKNMSKLHGFDLLILRLPLLAGEGAPGNLGRMIKAIRKRRYLSINGGRAKRSIVLAQDVAKFVVSNKEISGVYNLTDDRDITFGEIESLTSKYYSTGMILNIPKWLGWILGTIGDILWIFPFNSTQFKLMTRDLTFSCKKIKEASDWNPNRVRDNFFL
jgi:nucleoside-diphosphate-sugar epimerase